MKRLINKLFFISAILALVVVGCKKDVEPTVSKVVKFPTTTPVTATTNTVTLAAADSSSNAAVIGFSWPAVDYGYNTRVTYTLQFDLPSDTLGVTPWSKAKSIRVGVDTLTQALNNRVLNTMALSLGLPVNVESFMVVRVNGFADRDVFSNGLMFRVTPYKPTPPNYSYVPKLKYLYIAGDFQPWDINNALPIAADTANAGTKKKFEGYINIPDKVGATFEYKLYTIKGNWGSASYGDFGANQADHNAGATGTFKLANYAGSNFKAPGAGYYEIGFNFADSTWSQVATTWGMIGDATPGLWTTDTDMTYDATNNVWTVTLAMKHNGSFKFRANHDWKIDFGADAFGKIFYADNPFLGGTSGLNNLTVPEDGNYTFTLDLSKPGLYTYTAVKN